MFERHHDIMERRNSGEASESGFTLIELLIVIVVLGILAAIVVFSLTGVTGESKQAACTTDAKSVEIAADAYQAAHSNSWPSNVQILVTDNYLKSVPVTDNGYTIGVTSHCWQHPVHANRRVCDALQRRYGLPRHLVTTT